MEKGDLYEGMRVRYVTSHKEEKGIVKRVHPEFNSAFVVYNCANDWDNYQNYTGALTSMVDLVEGWGEQEILENEDNTGLRGTGGE